MRGLLTGVQSLLMRGIGMRKLGDALDAKSDATQAGILSRFDALQASLADRDRALGDRLDVLGRRLDALGAQLSDQGQADTERGEDIQNTLRDLRTGLDQVQHQIGRSGQSGQTLADLRAEIAGLRADFALEAELAMDKIDGRKPEAVP